MENKKVVVFGRSNPVCPYCENAKVYLEENNISYDYKDISQEAYMVEFQERYLSKGISSVPQISVDGVEFGGFDNITSVITEVGYMSPTDAEKPFVLKRGGERVPRDLDKVHKVLTWAAEGLDDVSVSLVEMKSHVQITDGVDTDTIHSTLVKAAADLISTDNTDYQYMAARLLMFGIRKEAYGEFKPPKLIDHVSKMVSLGKYDNHLVEDYTAEEFETLNNMIVHDRDMNLAYAGAKQMQGKYLVQDRTKGGKIYESPQMLYILVAMGLHAAKPKDTRLALIKRFYDATSSGKISLPTPIMAGVRTPTRQFSSCVLIESDDSLDSINATASSIVKYVSQKAGIGINAGRIRALGSAIRGGEAEHTGCIPFYKHFQTAIKSCSQGLL